MATKTKQWSTGTGSATIQYGGQGDGNIIITSDANSLYEARSMQIVVETTDGSGIQRVVTVNQAAKQRIDLSAAVVTAANQTYSGSAKTPTPTVTLNGSTVPSTGYDVSYSDNTNAGTATITITGKGDYTGTASGTFTINKATPTYTAPTYNNWTYDGSSHYLVTAGSTNHGTIQFSTDGSSWSTTRPTQTNAGVYYTYWRLVGDNNHTDISPASIRTDVSKATPTYTTPTRRTGLTYSGSSQYLTTSGSTSHGTIYYSTDGSNWYTSRRTGTNAGTYYCYWKLVGDSNHSDVASTYLGTTTIAKASRTITATYHPATIYIGESKTPTFSVSAGSNDGIIVLTASSNSVSISGNTLTGVSTGYSIITAEITEGNNYLSASTSWGIETMDNLRHGITLSESLDNNTCILTNGSEVSSPYYDTTGFIAVTPGERLQFRSSGSYGMYCYSAYTSSSQSSISKGNSETGVDDGVHNLATDYDVTIPSGIFYIRICNDSRVLNINSVDIYFV